MYICMIYKINEKNKMTPIYPVSVVAPFSSGFQGACVNK